MRNKFFISVATIATLAFATSPSAADDDAKLALGRKVFTEISAPSCPVCHTLTDAGASGEVGPNLDVLQPDEARVATAVTQGIGAMPANEALTEEQVQAVAHYVATVAGKQ